MLSTARTLLAGSILAWTAAFAFSAVVAQGASAQKTTNDGLYTKAQADSARAQFTRLCASCHAFTMAARKRPTDVPLGDEPFLRKWNGRSLDELATLIAMTMPNDGSAVVSDAEAIDLVAYILQQNGYPAGTKPLTKDTSTAVVAPPKK